MDNIWQPFPIEHHRHGGGDVTTPEQPELGDSDIDAIKRGHVPVVDLEAAASGDPATRSDIAAEVGAACESLGFLVVTGHGVPSETVDKLMSASWRYFNLPEDDKRRWMPPSPYVFRGYFPIQSSALAGSLDVETPPDLCEVFAVNRFDDPADAAAAGLSEGREGFFAPNIWPDVEGFRDAWTGYYRAMESLADELMALMARALGLEEGWFDDKIDQHISNLVVNHYPAQRTPPVEGQIRRGAHNRLRVAQHPVPRRQPRRPPGSATRWCVGRHPPRPGLVCDQSRRPDGRMDQRPLGIDHAPRGQPQTRVLRHVAHVGRVLPPTQLRRRDHLYPHLHHRRRSPALRTSDVGTMGSRQTLKVRLLTQAAP